MVARAFSLRSYSVAPTFSWLANCRMPGTNLRDSPLVSSHQSPVTPLEFLHRHIARPNPYRHQRQ